jgi:hypothetical protein
MQTTQPEHIAEGTTMSTLSILNAKPSDSGKYTCKPAQLEQASVNLHVLECKLNKMRFKAIVWIYETRAMMFKITVFDINKFNVVLKAIVMI